MPLPNPVIVVPGITGVDLHDLYNFPPEKIWSLTARDYRRSGLHPEDGRYEGQLPAQVRPEQMFSVAYKEMILDLRHDLSQQADRPVPVHGFNYDWRQPLEITQGQLAAFIEEVTNKTALLSHYYADNYGQRRQVNLVGHSMGGIVVAGYLADVGAAAPVQRVATIAAPFKGTFQAVERIVKGANNRREREAARLTPALYYLLPSFHLGITIDPRLPQTDLFDQRLWQPGVLDTIQEALRLRGSGAVLPTPANAQAILQSLLAQAQAHRQAVDQLNPATCGLRKQDWLCFIGIGEKTQVAIDIQVRNGAPWFVLDGPGMVDNQQIPGWRTGDGTVPYEGALPNFPTTHVILRDNDFGTLELRDRLLDAFAGLHGILPNMNKLQGLLAEHLL